jgi:hypothetical protein
MIILVSADPPGGGLVAAYLAQSDDPPGPPTPAGTLGPWAASIAEDLSAAYTAFDSGDDKRHLKVKRVHRACRITAVGST